jgi:hypothetical protein
MVLFYGCLKPKQNLLQGDLRMSKNNSLFSQLLGFFPRHEFQRMVNEHKAEYKTKGFSCWQQFVAMLFCQLGRANSLNEITKGLATCEGKLSHLGITAPKKSTLAYANEHRPWELYQSVFFGLLEKTRFVAAITGRKFKFKAKLYSMDATVIDLCLSMYEWAHFRRAKGAVKLHMRLDHDGYLPDYAVITDGKHHESRVARQFPYSPGSITVFDKGYTDFTLFNYLCTIGAFFVTRLKENAVFEVLTHLDIPKKSPVLSDRLVRFTGATTNKKCPHILRIVKYYDKKHDRIFFFLTNKMNLGALTIAAIYKDRWAIENFFKALKQYLKIKTFVGTSANAVKTQIWTALISILLLKYLQLKSTMGWSLSNLSALLRMNLFTYRDLLTWINKPFETPPVQVEMAEQMALALV